MRRDSAYIELRVSREEGEHEEVVERAQGEVEHQLYEVDVVMKADAVVDEDTVMVHPNHTLLASIAVLNPQRLHLVTLGAFLSRIN